MRRWFKRHVIKLEKKTRMSVTASFIAAAITYPVSNYLVGNSVPSWAHAAIQGVATLGAGIIWNVNDDKGGRAS